MATFPFFDCNCMLGRRTRPRPENNLTDGEILAELARHDIKAVLCTHSLAQELDPKAGNDALVSGPEVRGGVTVHRCFTLIPHHTGEMPGGDALVAYLRHGNARAVRLHPRDHSYSLNQTCCGDMLSTLEPLGLPVLVDLGQTSWAELCALCASHPRLAFIALRIGYREDRRAYPVLEQHENLWLETSYYVGHRAIEHFVGRFGAGRLVFGTGMPLFAPGGAMSHVLYAEISDEAKALIAGGNLQRLLGRAKAVA